MNKQNTVNMLLSCLIILLFSACFSGWKSDEGAIIINLGGEGRAVWPPSSAMLAKMDYTVTLSGNGEVIKRTSKGSGTIRTTVSVGRWNVQVDASYEKEPYASGSASAEVKAGQNNQVSIQISQVIKFYKEFYAANEGEWNEARTAIANEESDTDLNYAINVTKDFKLPGSTENTFGKVKGINIYVRGNHTISLYSQGNILRIGAGQTVTLQDTGFAGLTNGKNGADMDNNTQLVFMENTSSIFIMTGSASLSGNTGGGVSVAGTFIMKGGSINNNSGACVYSQGRNTFIMDGGSISDNSGLCVYILASCTFTMNGGTISGNTGTIIIESNCTFNMTGGSINNNSSTSDGSGVYVGGTFNMTGGTISGNRGTYPYNNYNSGGGVYLNNGTFNMSDGTISNNSCTGNGGGVYVSGTFNMSGGTISGNYTAARSSSYGNGGGIYVSSGTFNMTGGNISGNTANSAGGGVYTNYTTFRMAGGTVYGIEAVDTLANRAAMGAALFSNDTTRTGYGTFAIPDDPASWTRNGTLDTTEETIRVVNGVLRE